MYIIQCQLKERKEIGEWLIKHSELVLSNYAGNIFTVETNKECITYLKLKYSNVSILNEI